MTRWTAIALVLVSAALAAVAAWVLDEVRRDRAAVMRQFNAERLAQVEKAAREIQAELDDVADDLRFASRLIEAADTPSDRERELRALLAAVTHYRHVAVFDDRGDELLSVVDPVGSPGFEAAPYDEAMHLAATRARRRPDGGVATSPPVGAGEIGWVRAFATSLPRGGVIVILVDTAPLFRPLSLVTPSAGSRLLILGPHRRPTPLSDPLLAEAIGDAPWLVEHLAAHEAGTFVISGAEAARAGLGDDALVVAHADIPVVGGEHWSIATLSSTAGLAARARATMWRIGLASGGVALCLLGFGAYVVVASRRAIAIRERLRHADAVTHLHEKSEKILDNVPAGVIALSEDGRVTSLNRALRDRVPPEVVGQALAAAFSSSSDGMLERIRLLVEEARALAKPRSLIGERATLFGREGHYSIHAIPLEPLFPDVRDLVVIEDVSQVHSLAAQLVRAEKLATVGVLAAGIAHEIGTPLGVVRARAELIRGKLGDEHPQTPGATVIVEQIDRITRTLRQLLDFSRPKSSESLSVEVEPVVRGVGELLRFEAQRRGVTLDVVVPGDLPRVAADVDELQQVLINLVMNACDACEGGPSDARVVVSAARGEGVVRLEVSDNGCGIPEELRHRVFDPFFTTKKRGKGTGLGLTIATQIVRSHGGHIDLESERGRGTRAILVWPVARAGREGRHAAS